MNHNKRNKLLNIARSKIQILKPDYIYWNDPAFNPAVVDDKMVAYFVDPKDIIKVSIDSVTQEIDIESLFRIQSQPQPLPQPLYPPQYYQYPPQLPVRMQLAPHVQNELNKICEEHNKEFPVDRLRTFKPPQ